MNEKVEQLIIDTGEELLSWMQSAEEFTIEQAPLLAQEIVSWGIWFYGIGAVLWAALSAILYIGGMLARTLITNEDSGSYAMDRNFSLFGICIASALPLVGVISCAAIALKAAIAPRLYIIEQIGKLL